MQFQYVDYASQMGKQKEGKYIEPSVILVRLGKGEERVCLSVKVLAVRTGIGKLWTRGEGDSACMV